MAKRVSAEAAELAEAGLALRRRPFDPRVRRGHPQGAANVPLLHMQGGRMAPNPTSMRVMQANFPKDSQLVLGCKAGGAPSQAAALLEAAGYTSVVDMRGGFGGERDAFGRVSVPAGPRPACPSRPSPPASPTRSSRRRSSDRPSTDGYSMVMPLLAQSCFTSCLLRSSSRS
jgi:rhodanese-related sulfurtransferase